MVKGRFSYRFFFFVLISLGGLEAAPPLLHVLLVADTDSHTGDMARLELNHVTREIRNVSRITGQELHLQSFSGGSSRGAFLETLELISVDKEDALIVYFIGHGYRTSDKQTPWPLFYFTDNDNLDMNQVLETVITKKPRFALVIGDCCNNVMDGLVTFSLFPLAGKFSNRVYKKLFLESQGILAICAAIPGDYAYCNEMGHCFSQGFWHALFRESCLGRADWINVLERTAASLAEIQKPYYEWFVYHQ